MTTSKRIILTGHDAITYARGAELRLGKHADPAEGPRAQTLEDGLTIDEARAVARVDPSLIWCAVLDTDALIARNLARSDVSGDVDDSYAHTGDSQDTIQRWYDSAAAGGDVALCDEIGRSGIQAIGIVYARVRSEMSEAASNP